MLRAVARLGTGTTGGGGGGIAEAPADGQLYGRDGLATAWERAQPADADLTAISALAGLGYAVRTGSSVWALNATVPWTDISGAPAMNFLPLAGGTMVGPIVLSGNGVAALNPVAFQQLAAYLTTAVAATTYAPIASPAFTGNPTAPTPTAGDNDTSVATTAFVTNAVGNYLPLTGGAVSGTTSFVNFSASGTATAATVTPSTDSTTKIATTAFVQSALGGATGGASIAASPPTFANGKLWFDSTGGQLYVGYDDGNSQQYVIAVNPPLPSSGVGSGTVSNIATTGPGITGGPITSTGTLAVQWNGGAVNTLGTGLSLSAGTLTATGLTTRPVAITINFAGGAVVANDTYVFTATAPFAFTVNSLDSNVGGNGGSFTANVRNAGTSITGLSAVAVSSSSKVNTAATGGNAVAAGAVVDVVITATSGSPKNAYLCINGVG